MGKIPHLGKGEWCSVRPTALWGEDIGILERNFMRGVERTMLRLSGEVDQTLSA